LQKLMGYMRRAIGDYRMISPGDNVAVGLSGGRDSAAMLAGLAGLRLFLGIDFSLSAITLDMGFEGGALDIRASERLCESLDIPYHVIPTNIARVVFDVRREKNPCSLCTKMRRGMLHEQCQRIGCNKLALGHHMDDALETFVMNLANEGRIGCFQPTSYMSRRNITVIRPMLYAPQGAVHRAAQSRGLPFVESRCPIDQKTQRRVVRDFLSLLESRRPGIKNRIYNAMRRAHVSDW
jgi:tRNA 2-thiocytidine biosynthesis protein TtcA